MWNRTTIAEREHSLKEAVFALNRAISAFETYAPDGLDPLVTPEREQMVRNRDELWQIGQSAFGWTD